MPTKHILKKQGTRKNMKFSDHADDFLFCVAEFHARSSKENMLTIRRIN